MDSATLQNLGRRALEIERDALSALMPRIDQHFSRACELMLACSGRVVVTGMGKRSEEHTSELQSLMRISYAVFCLKKKNKTKENNISTAECYNSSPTQQYCLM